MVSVQGRKSQQKGALNRVVHLMVARGRGKERQTERQRKRSKAARQVTTPVTYFLQLGPTSYASITCPSDPSQGARPSIHETMVTGRTELKLLWQGGGLPQRWRRDS